MVEAATTDLVPLTAGAPTGEEGQMLSFIAECKQSGIDYRLKFKQTWDECENQIRCILPEEYRLKEDWQTKIFIPTQSKNSEVAQSNLNSMLFGKLTNFDLTPTEGINQDMSQQIVKLTSSVLEDGDFPFQNKFVVAESVDLGTGFIKIIMAGKNNVRYIWRSPLSCVFDKECLHDLDKARFWIDMYEKDINFLRMEYNKEKSIYKKDAIKKYFDDAEAAGKAVQETKDPQKPNSAAGVELNKSVESQKHNELRDAMCTVKGIDGTTDIMIPSAYRTVKLDECWIKYPNAKGEFDNKVVTVINDKHIIRNEENIFGFIPAVWMRIKPRKYDSYGKGYVENTRGLQDLANSCVNLGFDSLKMNSMDIVLVDEKKVSDPNSIKYKPLAVWKMKDINGAKLTRGGVSSMMDILRGLAAIDQIHQEASGILRASQGAQELGGAGSGSDTLGEYKLKLQAIDKRFLDTGRFVEQDYMLPLVRKTISIFRNKKLYDQDRVNEILGFKTVTKLETVDGQTKTSATAVPKLDLDELRKISDANLKFRMFGVTQFTDRAETLEKLKEALTMISKVPQLAQMTKVDVLWKRLWQISEIPDYEEFIKSAEEMKQDLMKSAPPGAQIPGQAPAGSGAPGTIMPPAEGQQVPAMA